MQSSLYKEADTAMNYSKNLASENDPSNNLNSSLFHIICKITKLTKESYFNVTFFNCSQRHVLRKYLYSKKQNDTKGGTSNLLEK